MPGDDLPDIATPSWRTRWTVLILAGVLTAVGLGILLDRPHQDGPGARAVVSLPPALPGVVSVDYVGSHWRLTAVTDGDGTTEIPESIDAWLELTADGKFVASDNVNAINGTFGATSAGFDLTTTIMGGVGYGGKDPVELAAIAGIDAMTLLPGRQATHVTVLTADHEHLTVQAGGVRLTFVRTRPAGKEKR